MLYYEIALLVEMDFTSSPNTHKDTHRNKAHDTIHVCHNTRMSPFLCVRTHRIEACHLLHRLEQLRDEFWPHSAREVSLSMTTLRHPYSTPPRPACDSLSNPLRNCSVTGAAAGHRPRAQREDWRGDSEVVGATRICHDDLRVTVLEMTARYWNWFCERRKCLHLRSF